MEAKHRINRLGLTKTAIFLVFLGLFITTQAQAGLLAPTLSVSPANTNVPNGDTVTINIQSSVTIGVLSTIGVKYNGGALPANANFITSTPLLELGGSVTGTLTITNMSSASAGTYTISSSTVGLLGGLLTTKATCTISTPPTITGLVAGSNAGTGSKMVANGFKIQFSAPTGSNLVIQASSDMTHWTSVYTNVVTGGTLTYTDAAAKTASFRYYRAKIK
ncbi:MAG TPA: hypothetical protein VH280_21210 [Verrucomicrobiae bacterium]|jgi:hypothetical protein|nr:hypothetical protein [Verrucomicrobiae bacterium]